MGGSLIREPSDVESHDAVLLDIGFIMVFADVSQTAPAVAMGFITALIVGVVSPGVPLVGHGMVAVACINIVCPVGSGITNSGGVFAFDAVPRAGAGPGIVAFSGAAALQGSFTASSIVVASVS